jgi:hypothetical protein
VRISFSTSGITADTYTWERALDYSQESVRVLAWHNRYVEADKEVNVHVFFDTDWVGDLNLKVWICFQDVRRSNNLDE